MVGVWKVESKCEVSAESFENPEASTKKDISGFTLSVSYGIDLDQTSKSRVFF